MSWAVSVIVPFYNAEACLGRCVDSLLAQDLAALEIILVDDASADSSTQLAQQYALRYPEKITCLRLSCNQGPGAARNAGMAVARGEYLGFVDADDTVTPNFFSAMYIEASQTTSEIVVCGICIEYTGIKRIINPEKKYTVKNFLGICKNKKYLFPPVWNKIFLRKFIKYNGIVFPNTYMCEDMVFSVKSLLSAKKISCINKPLYIYKKKSSSITFSITKCIDTIPSLAEVKKFFQEKNMSMFLYRKIFYLHAIYNPACLVLIEGLLRGKNRWKTLWNSPAYLYALCKSLLRGDV